MKLGLITLSASLIVIIFALVTHRSEAPRDLGIATPKGIPPSQKPLPAIPRVAQPVAAEPRVNTPLEADHPDSTEQSAWPESIQREQSRWSFVTVRARIFQNGQPLSGAFMVAQQVTIKPDTGHRDTATMFDFVSMGHDRRSDHDGNISLKARYRVDTDEDAVFGVAVFHTERGTAYDEIGIKDLEAGLVLELQPEMGEVLTGRVIGGDGKPIPNAKVSISTSWPKDAVCLTGLGARTMHDGSFMIPGFGFENKLQSIHVIAHNELPADKGLIAITEHGSADRVVNPETDFNAEENAWQLGDISLALTKHAVDLTTGEATQLPSDE